VARAQVIAFASISTFRESIVLCAPRCPEKLQFSQKVVLADDEFHRCADLEKGRGLGRPRSPKERRDSRIGNYIGREGVLKSRIPALVLTFE
jgi:hypothetical protein